MRTIMARRGSNGSSWKVPISAKTVAHQETSHYALKDSRVAWSATVSTAPPAKLPLARQNWSWRCAPGCQYGNSMNYKTVWRFPWKNSFPCLASPRPRSIAARRRGGWIPQSLTASSALPDSWAGQSKSWSPRMTHADGLPCPIRSGRGRAPRVRGDRGRRTRGRRFTGPHRTRGLFLMAEAWRILKQQHANTAFNGEGAAKFGGRWNSRGVSVVYTSGTKSLAILENLVHMNARLGRRASVCPVKQIRRAARGGASSNAPRNKTQERGRRERGRVRPSWWEKERTPYTLPRIRDGTPS